MLKKTVALTIMIVFVCVFTASAYPLHAQETPGAVERVGKASAQSGGGSILPIVLIGVGVLAVAAVLIFVVFKTTYDITGTWTFIITNGSASEPLIFIFTGTKDSGTWTVSGAPTALGTYTVSDKNVTIAVTTEPSLHIAGTFTGKDSMSGTWGSSGVTWTATRTAAAAGVSALPAHWPQIPGK
jgi:hypothetical protein